MASRARNLSWTYWKALRTVCESTRSLRAAPAAAFRCLAWRKRIKNSQKSLRQVAGKALGGRRAFGRLQALHLLQQGGIPLESLVALHFATRRGLVILKQRPYMAFSSPFGTSSTLLFQFNIA